MCISFSSFKEHCFCCLKKNADRKSQRISLALKIILYTKEESKGVTKRTVNITLPLDLQPINQPCNSGYKLKL